MSVPGALLAVPLLLLQGGFPGAAGDSVALKEGENLILNCTFSTLGNNNFTLQWSNPLNFTIFLNAQKVLRDQRYKLLHYSKDELSIQLSNVTEQDEGIYSCMYYTRHVKTKTQNVEILAAPSHPVLEVSQDEGRGINLSCYTQGGRPQPQISWLLDNGIELPGDTRHQLGADGKKWSTRSTLRILSYSPGVTASCIIQHPALGARRLLASFPFQDLSSSGCKQGTRRSEDAKVPSPSENPSVSSSPENPAENPAVSSPSASPENPAVPSSAPAQPNLTDVTLNERDPKSKGLLRKEKNLLLPFLVAALILVLLIIVLLFMVKLKKAHGVWRRENDASEQTLESYKSRSNEDSPGHEKNGQAGNPKPNLHYVTEGHMETPEKNMETPEKNLETPEKNLSDKITAINGEMSPCGRETDV
ncbi:cytotoxic and regulatory T-cell molecule isoform X3 [Motacilla alba alba]|uniref:cytotoxic and regulatory T-cell molecule isoform X3 n=1 Tax=Motacilla alba alba TaxID=1094192 RepID=UPI0018D52B45|nr:cytotoxic and regulatory T-cell molecule isoform X3 [Motacilla alba alba]